VVVPPETHGPNYRPSFNFVSLLFEEGARRAQVCVGFVTTRTPEYVTAPVGVVLFTIRRAGPDCIGF